MSSKVIVILGYGPAVGDGVAKVFGKNGFTLVLVARNQEKLDAAVAGFGSQGIKAHAYAADFGNTDSTLSALRRITAEVGNIDVFVFNGKPSGVSSVLTATSDDLSAYFQSVFVTLIAAIQFVAAEQKKNGGGTIILTGGGFGLNGAMAGTYNLHLTGAANAFWHNLAESLGASLKRDNIHVGTVIIAGMVNEGDPKHSPELVGQKFFELYSQPADAWTDKIIY